MINRVGHALSEWIYIGGVKAFSDGSLGSNSALLYEVRSDIQTFHLNYLNKKFQNPFTCPFSIMLFLKDMGME